MKPLIYLGSPYSHDDPAVVEKRFQAVCRYAASLMRIGVKVFSPIAHTHPIAQYDLPKGWDFWQQYDEAFLERCDAMIVLMLDGYRESKGLRGETEYMRKHGKPIEWHTEDGRCVMTEGGKPHLTHAPGDLATGAKISGSLLSRLDDHGISAEEQ